MLSMLSNLVSLNSTYKEDKYAPTKEFIKRIFTNMSLISGLVTLGLVLCSFLFSFNKYYIIFCLIISLLFFVMLMLDIGKKDNLARLYGTTVLPSFISIATLCCGQGFSEAPVMLAFLMFAYFLFDKNPKLKNRIIAFNLIFHLSVMSYLAFYPPLIGTFNYPFDEVVVFFLALGWIYVFLKKYEYEKNKMFFRLQEKNKKLLATTEELERFTYIASHDLKSPLRTIISFSDLTTMHLKRGQYDKLEDDLSFIKSGAHQMNYLVQDILEFSQINGKTDVEKKEIDLNDILEKVESNLLDEMNEKKVEIVKEELPSYYGNKTEFVLLFQNLIQNGIKYNTSESPLIQIGTIESDTSLCIYIKDNGIGIEAEYHEKIFQFFKRLHTSIEYQGTGLGLGLCKKLIEKYGGQISIESQLGLGSTFIIELPKEGIGEAHLKRSEIAEVCEVRS